MLCFVGDWFLTFRSNIVPLSFQKGQTVLDEVTAFLRNVWNHSPVTKRQVPEGLNPQQHCCENVKFRKLQGVPCVVNMIIHVINILGKV